MCAEQIGGRLTDLELLVTKLKTKRSPKECLDELVGRAISEISQIGFLKGKEETVPWTSVQFWKLAQLLAKFDEVSFDHLRFHSLFKGDGKPFIEMEKAGIVTIFRDQGREMSIRAGKPIFRAAFQQMVADTQLAAAMGIDTYKVYISEEEKKLKKAEEEISQLSSTLKSLPSDSIWSYWTPPPNTYQSISQRIHFLGQQINQSSIKIEKWQKQLDVLKLKLKLAE